MIHGNGWMNEWMDGWTDRGQRLMDGLCLQRLSYLWSRLNIDLDLVILLPSTIAAYFMLETHSNWMAVCVIYRLVLNIKCDTQFINSRFINSTTIFYRGCILILTFFEVVFLCLLINWKLERILNMFSIIVG